jgi:hypothetical protein
VFDFGSRPIPAGLIGRRHAIAAPLVNSSMTAVSVNHRLVSTFCEGTGCDNARKIDELRRPAVTRALFRSSLWGSFNVVMFNTVIFFLCMAHMRAVITDPGTLPLSPSKLDFSDMHSSESGLAQPCPRPPLNWCLSGCDYVDWTVCTRCEIYRPPRAHHCRICRRCIRRMDHHCPWINNCVGERNQKYFLQFLIYVGVLSVYAIVLVSMSWLTECTECSQEIPIKQARM